MVLTRIKQLLIELHEKGISELQRHQVSETCSTTVEVMNAYTLPERHEDKEIACDTKAYTVQFYNRLYLFKPKLLLHVGHGSYYVLTVQNSSLYNSESSLCTSFGPHNI
jgi:hypothetical protein